MKIPTDEIQRQKFWEQTWANAWNIIGLISLGIGFPGILGFVGWQIFGPAAPPRPPTKEYVYVKRSTSKEVELQKVFDSAITGAKQPCSVKYQTSKKTDLKTGLSDISGCSLFGLRLGMSVDEVKEIIDKSGYFNQKSDLTKSECDKEKVTCKRIYIYQARDGFSVSADFRSKASEDKALITNSISLTFEPGVHPYFDPQSLKPAFVKVFGEPYYSRDNTLRWGDNIDGPSADAFIYPDSRSVIISLSAR